MSKLETDNSGIRFWFNEKGQYHRIGGPAVEWSDGHKQWFSNGNQYYIKNFYKTVSTRAPSNT